MVVRASFSCVCMCVQVVLLHEKTPSKQFVMPNEVQSLQTDNNIIVEDDELLH